MTSRLLDFAQATWGVEPRDITITTVDYPNPSLATGGLWRVHTPDREYFVKLIQHVRHAPAYGMIPPHVAEQLAAEFPWRFELEIAQSGIAAVLPDGLRTAELCAVDELDDEHAYLWWEWLQIAPTPWSEGDFRQAAHALGRLAARRREGAAINERLPEASRAWPAGYAFRMYVERRELGTIWPMVDTDEVWSHPHVATWVSTHAPALRTELRALAGRIPQLLDELDTLPQTYAHGDASTANLIRTPDDRSRFVVIDWGIGSLLAVGFDLGQLLVSQAQEGISAPGSIRQIHPVILAAYADGIRTEGFDVTAEQIRAGYLKSLACRSIIGSFPIDRLDDAPYVQTRLELVHELLALTADYC